MDELKRIVVTVDNEVGVIAGITSVLANGGINLEGIHSESTGQEGIIVLMVKEDDHALYLLNQAGYKAVSDSAVVIRLADQPGALAAVAQELKDAGINIRNMHILSRHNGHATAVLTTDDQELTRRVISHATVI